jgi:hypothetical protein
VSLNKRLTKGKERKEGMEKGYIGDTTYQMNYGIRWKGYCLGEREQLGDMAKIIDYL